MEVLQANDSVVVLKMSRLELVEIKAAVSSVRDEHSILDQAILEMSYEQVAELDDKLFRAIEESQKSLSKNVKA